MLVGVPKEIKDNEYRVGLVPSTVRELASNGHQVIVETGAGARRRARLTPTTRRPAPRSSRAATRFSATPNLS